MVLLEYFTGKYYYFLYIVKLPVDFSFPGEVVGGADENRKSLSIPNPIISVSDTGVLSSSGVTGHTMLQITSVDEYGLKQTINIVVEVSRCYIKM